MSYTFKIPKSKIEETKSGVLVNEERVIPYRDGLKIRFQWKKKNNNRDFSASLKVQVPSRYAKIDLKFKIFVTRAEGQAVGITLKNTKYVYDDGRSQGAGGFGLDRTDIPTETLFKECVQKDDNIIFIFRILSIRTYPDWENMLSYLEQQVPQERPLESDVLKKRVDDLMQAMIQSEQESVEIQDQLRSDGVRLESLVDGIQRYEKEIKETAEENQRFENDISELKNRIVQIGKNLGECTLNDALLNFDPDTVGVHMFDVPSLKNLMSNILALQLRLSEEMLQHDEERCGFCSKIFPCQMSKCGHVAICRPCFRQKPKCPVCEKRIDALDPKGDSFFRSKKSKSQSNGEKANSSQESSKKEESDSDEECQIEAFFSDVMTSSKSDLPNVIILPGK